MAIMGDLTRLETCHTMVNMLMILHLRSCPVWQNKSQAMAFEDSIYTRTSHFSYEIKK